MMHDEPTQHLLGHFGVLTADVALHATAGHRRWPQEVVTVGDVIEREVVRRDPALPQYSSNLVSDLPVDPVRPIPRSRDCSRPWRPTRSPSRLGTPGCSRTSARDRGESWTRSAGNGSHRRPAAACGADPDIECRSMAPCRESPPSVRAGRCSSRRPPCRPALRHLGPWRGRVVSRRIAPPVRTRTRPRVPRNTAPLLHPRPTITRSS